MITREKFVKICTEAIHKTRSDLAIRNQVSGYLRFHKEIKDNDYFKRARSIMSENLRANGYSLSDQYELIKRSKMGACHELAEYLSVEIIDLLKAEHVEARIRIVSSKIADHVYLHINILLKDEKNRSLWEVDAWRPRIIDVSMRPDGTIKNAEATEFGPHPRLLFSTGVKDFKRRKLNSNLIFAVQPPTEGISPGSATPEREVIDKHPDLYSDCTLDDAYEDKQLDKEGEIHYLQRQSHWQKL